MGLPLPKAEGRRHKHDGPQRRLSNTLRRFRNWEAIGCTTRAGHLVTDLESYKATWFCVSAIGAAGEGLVRPRHGPRGLNATGLLSCLHM